MILTGLRDAIRDFSCSGKAVLSLDTTRRIGNKCKKVPSRVFIFGIHFLLQMLQVYRIPMLVPKFPQEVSATLVVFSKLLATVA